MVSNCNHGFHEGWQISLFAEPPMSKVVIFFFSFFKSLECFSVYAWVETWKLNLTMVLLLGLTLDIKPQKHSRVELHYLHSTGCTSDIWVVGELRFSRGHRMFVSKAVTIKVWLLACQWIVLMPKPLAQNFYFRGGIGE